MNPLGFFRRSVDSAAQTKGRVSLMEEGWGLPFILFAFSALIAATCFLAALDVGHLRDMSDSDWGIIFAVGAGLCQWGANSAMLRSTRIRYADEGWRKIRVLALFAIFAVGTTLALDQAARVYRAPAYEAERARVQAAVDGTKTQREDLERRQKDAMDRIERASAALGNIATNALDTFGSRSAEGNSAANSGLAADQLLLQQINAQLAALPQPLPEERPWDKVDTYLFLFCALLSIVEFLGYSSLLPAPAAARSTPKRKSAPPAKEAPPAQDEDRVIKLNPPKPAPRATRTASASSKTGGDSNLVLGWGVVRKRDQR